MLTGMIIAQFVVWILGFFVKGICLYNILLIIPTAMFAGRKIGFYKKWTSSLVVEVLLLLFSVVWSLLFHKFIWWKYLLILILRIISIGIIFYDDSVYLYIREEYTDDE